MNRRNGHGRGALPTRLSSCCLVVYCLCFPSETHAICGLDGAFLDQIRDVDDLEVSQDWTRQMSRQGNAACVACHLAGYGPRNQYGNAINILVTANDRDNSALKREAGRRVSEIPANPSLPDSPTFGDLIRRGLLPAADLPAVRNIPATPPEVVTVEQAGELVRNVEGESRFGILQLSRTHEMSPEVAAVLAEFRGEMLILGLRSLSPEVARAVEKSKAATVWLHSVTEMAPAAAEAIARVPGHLVLSGLMALDSVPLAKKLARRPGALSLPYLNEIAPEIALALGENPRGLTLAGLTDLSPAVQEALARAAGALNRGKEVRGWGGLDKSPQLFIGGRGPSGASPSLTPALAAELARYRGRLSIAGLRKLSPEAAVALVPYRGPSLELAGPATDKLSPETAAALAKFPGNLQMPLKVLDSGPLAEKFARQSQRSLDGLESISAEAIPAYVKCDGFFTLRQLTVLDSPELAARLIQDSAGQVLPSLRTISPAAAEVLGRSSNKIHLGLTALDDLNVAFALRNSGKDVQLPRLRAATPKVLNLLASSETITMPEPETLHILPERKR